MAADAERGAAEPACDPAKVEVNDFRASAGIRIGAVVRLLCNGVIPGSEQVCFIVNVFICM